MVLSLTLPTLTVNSGSGGSLSEQKTIDMDVSTSFTCTAIPNAGYQFSGWSDNKGTATRTFTVEDLTSSNTTITAKFEVATYRVTVSAGNGGKVKGSSDYYAGEIATLTATPDDGYRFKQWSDGNKENPRIFQVYENVSYEAEFEKTHCLITFKSQDESIISSYQVENGATVTTIPTITRDGYTFMGWLPCQPAKTMAGTILDSQKYTGEANSFAALSQNYKYMGNLTVHIDAYMSDWSNLFETNKQIISCTQSGGWGIGMYAGGTEINTAGSYTVIDLGLTSLTSGWHSFDIVFTNGLFTAYVDGQKKGERTTSATLIQYNSDNTIFVGGEAGTSDSTVENSSMNFVGLISNVFIANQGQKLEFATENTIIQNDVTYYPVWRLNNALISIFANNNKPNKIYVDKQLAKIIYIDTTKVYDV